MRQNRRAGLNSFWFDSIHTYTSLNGFIFYKDYFCWVLSFTQNWGLLYVICSSAVYVVNFQEMQWHTFGWCHVEDNMSRLCLAGGTYGCVAEGNCMPRLSCHMHKANTVFSGWPALATTVVDINKVKIVTNVVRDPSTVNYIKVVWLFGCKTNEFAPQVAANNRRRSWHHLHLDSIFSGKCIPYEEFQQHWWDERWWRVVSQPPPLIDRLADELSPRNVRAIIWPLAILSEFCL